MPELPEVETVMRGLQPVMQDKTLQAVMLNRPDLRFPFDPQFVDATQGQIIKSMTRRGKYMIWELSNDIAIIVHLGMSGVFKIIVPADTYIPAKHDHVVFELDDGHQVIFNDPRRFGFMILSRVNQWQKEKPFAEMGPEPLGNDFNAPAMKERLKGKKTSIKAALLDQRVVAGLGNIYACEAFYDCGISPVRNAGTLNSDEIEVLVQAIRDVLNKAIRSGGSSLKDYYHADGSLGYFQHQFKVYDREALSARSVRT